MTTARDQHDQRDQRDPQRNAQLRRELVHVALTLVALVALLAVAIIAAHFDAGRLAPVIAMTFSAIKALLVAIIFMRLAREPGVVRLFAAAGLLWLAILFTLALADYQTRPARATDHAEAQQSPGRRTVPKMRAQRPERK